MAVAVIGGLITSTVLSLVLVPVVYEFVDDFEHWLKPKLAGSSRRATRPRCLRFPKRRPRRPPNSLAHRPCSVAEWALDPFHLNISPDRTRQTPAAFGRQSDDRCPGRGART